MKAIIHTVYGEPDVLELREVAKPVPKEHEVLIKIHATTVNRTDCGFRKPEYFIVRLISGLFKPRKHILGSELAGVIEAIGKQVKTFKVGDAVFGLSTFKFGAHAEYICMSEQASIALKPVNMTFAEAASIADGLMLAMNYIRKIDFTKAPRILINGASGSIGSASLQLAKHYGANVTAVCNTKNMPLIKSLGADYLIDYSQDDFTRHAQVYDVVLDAVGKSSFAKCKPILKPGGVYFSSELGDWGQNVFFALMTPLMRPFLGGKKVGFPIPTDSQADMLIFKELIEAGYFKAVIDRRYRLEQIVEATRYVETGEKTGNVVITVV